MVERLNITSLGASGQVYHQAYVIAPLVSQSKPVILTGKNQFRWYKMPSWGPRDYQTM